LSFNKKAAVLSAIVVILSAVYILSFVFEPGKRGSKSFAWIEQRFLDMADRVELYGDGGKTELVRRNNIWFFRSETSELPVKQGRVEDLFSALSGRYVYPVRAVSSEARERLGLGEGSATRIIVRGGAGLPLLDLLIGKADALGREIYLKRAEWNEIYSGEDRFTYFSDSKPSSWYDLRLFSLPAGSGTIMSAGSYSIDAVQQAEISTPGNEAFILRRSGQNWIIPGNEAVDSNRVDAWLRSLLEAEGDDFALSAAETAEAGITLWFGDGSVRTIEAGILNESSYENTEGGEKNRSLRVSGSPYVYKIGEWNYNRLFRGLSYFLRNEQVTE